MEQKILVVDDDNQVTSFLERFFKRHGYQVTTATTAKQLYKAIKAENYDLIILDLILPDEDGFEAAKRIRADHETPIIMLTARDEMYDRIVGLELGADDYVTKPYEPRELLARARSVMRRYNGPSEKKDAPGYCRFDAFEIDMIRSKVTCVTDASEIPVTSTEYALLRALADAKGDVLTREKILAAVYGNSVQITDRAIDAHVVRLRKKLSAASDGNLIQTVHGVGYKLAALVTTNR